MPSVENMVAADVGSLECAAGQWLQRLRREENLPPKSMLETLRRREATARGRAEALCDSEAKRASLAQDCLEHERRLHAQREEMLAEAQASLLAERRLRLEAEAALAVERHARDELQHTLAMEAERRVATEADRAALREQIRELNKVIESDETLCLLDEFKLKLESQREEIASLRVRSTLWQQEGADAAAALENLRRDYDVERKSWSEQRSKLLQERAAAVQELAQLRQAGQALQRAAEATLAACETARAKAAAAEKEASEQHRKMLEEQQRHAETDSSPPQGPQATDAAAAAVELAELAKLVALLGQSSLFEAAESPGNALDRPPMQQVQPQQVQPQPPQQQQLQQQ